MKKHFKDAFSKPAAKGSRGGDILPSELSQTPPLPRDVKNQVEQFKISHPVIGHSVIHEPKTNGNTTTGNVKGTLANVKPVVQIGSNKTVTVALPNQNCTDPCANGTQFFAIFLVDTNSDNEDDQNLIDPFFNSMILDDFAPGFGIF